MDGLNHIMTGSSKFSIKLVRLALHFSPSPKIKLLDALWFTFKTRGHNLIQKLRLLIGSKP